MPIMETIASLPPADERGKPELIAAIRDEIAANSGRITFARFMELALYHPEFGYYLAPARRPGREGDFLTVPEMHPFFGFTLARQLAECWERLGRPSSFTIREYGAGVGGLAYDIIAGLSKEAPELAASLDYRLIEPNRHRREQALNAMTEIGLAGQVRAEIPTANEPLPPITGVILANEVADALPVHRLVVGDGTLRECYVAWRDDWFAWEEGPLSDPALGADLLVQEIPLTDGDILDVSPAAASWFTTAAHSLTRGYALVIDYGYPAAELYRAHRLQGTLRAYYRHTVTDDPFRHIGEQDLTAHVDFTALQRAGEEAGLDVAGSTNQADFLANLGLGDYLVELQQQPDATITSYRTTQAAVIRMIDPGGPGRFGVLIMARDTPTAPPLRGFRQPTLS